MAVFLGNVRNFLGQTFAAITGYGPPDPETVDKLLSDFDIGLVEVDRDAWAEP